MYQDSKLQFLNFGFLEENFKDKLQDILKELKTCMTNEKGARELWSIPHPTPPQDATRVQEP
jgi:hypothetical protein